MKRRPIRTAIAHIKRAFDPKVSAGTVDTTDEPQRPASSLDGDFNPLPPVATATKPRMNISNDLLRKLGGAPDPSIGSALAQASPRTHQGTTAIRAQFHAEQMQRAGNIPFKK